MLDNVESILSFLINKGYKIFYVDEPSCGGCRPDLRNFFAFPNKIYSDELINKINKYIGTKCMYPNKNGFEITKNSPYYWKKMLKNWENSEEGIRYKKWNNENPNVDKAYQFGGSSKKNKKNKNRSKKKIKKIGGSVSNKPIIGLLPCAGTASRLHNLPKFMLPLKDTAGCLLSQWVYILLSNNCDKIIIGLQKVLKYL
jgi:hypothetical protein